MSPEFSITSQFITDCIIDKIREFKITHKFQIKKFESILYDTLLRHSYNNALTLSILHKVPGIITQSWASANIKNEKKIDLNKFLPKVSIGIQKGLITISTQNKKHFILYKSDNRDIIKKIKNLENPKFELSEETKRYKKFVESNK